MHSTVELIKEATSLPVEERTMIVDSLLKSLNTPDPELDLKWAKVAHQRFNDLKSGKVKAIPGNVVFDNIRKRFGK
ncbi:MAG: addiction module protein [Victivallales bacterium]|jgi:putative addiction module component (TIGR02574 family)